MKKRVQAETKKHLERLYYWLPIGADQVYYGYPIGLQRQKRTKWPKKLMCGKERWH